MFVLAGLGAGGAERVVSLISASWVASGDRVHIVAFDRPDDPVFHGFDPRIVLMRLGLPPGTGGGIRRSIRRLRALRRVLRVLRPDVTVSFLTKINVLTALATIGTCPRLVVSERNNPLAQDASQVWQMAQTLLLRQADAIVMQTMASLRCIPARARGRARVIANPIAAPGHAPDLDGSLLVAAGRLTAQKGFDLLIKAFAHVARKHATWHLRIHGEGPARPELEQLIAAHGMNGRVSLPGISHRAGGWLEAASAMVLSSRYEGMPNVLGEAMATGLPVIAFDCAFGPAEMITHQVNGLLVPAGDVGGLAAALDRVMGDPSLRTALGAAARARAAHFAPEIVIAKWDELMDAVVTGRKVPRLIRVPDA